MTTISDKIIARVKRKGRGVLFTPRDFLDLGARTALDKALSRLSDKGVIRRLARGIYDYPKKHKLLGVLWPSLNDVAKEVAKDSNSRLQLTGSQALYALGLTTQVPAKSVFLTDGRSRDIKIGNSKLHLVHASPKLLAGSGKKAGLVLQVIRYLGKDGLSASMIKKIGKLLNNEDKQDLKDMARFAPCWSRDEIYKLAAF